MIAATPAGCRRRSDVLLWLPLACAAVLAVGGCGNRGGSSSGVPTGHAVDRSVRFRDHYGTVAVTVASAGVAGAVFKDLSGNPDRAELGEFVFVTFSRFQLPAVESPGDLLEVRGSDGKLYASSLSDGPDSGGALAGSGSVDSNHFTEAFDLPRGAVKGAVLIVHGNGTGRDGFDVGGRLPPPGYYDGAHEIGLGL